MAFTSLGGGLNFGGAPDMNFSDPAGSYRSAFNAARDLNQQLYQNQLAGHAERLSNYQNASNSLVGGFRGLQRGVMRMLAGSNRANLQDIADSFTALSGQQTQRMIDAGLGNTTIQQSVQRGLAEGHAKEATRARGTFAQLMASSRASIGQARLAAQERGINAMSGIQGDRLAMMERVSAPYPDVGTYAQLAMAGGSRSPWGGGAFGGGPALPGMPGPSPGYRPIGGGMHQFAGDGAGYYDSMPDSGVGLYSGMSGLGSYSGTGYSPVSAEPSYSLLPGYEHGDSGVGPYVPPGSYPQVEAVY